MIEDARLAKIGEKIQLLRATALELKAMGEGVPIVERNTVRMLASIKMLELGISDILSI